MIYKVYYQETKSETQKEKTQNLFTWKPIAM